jgi:SnoaL-like domain
MNEITELIDRYIAIWNETDDNRRRDLIKQTWTDDSTYVDPLMHGEGHAGLNTMIAGVQKQLPGLIFTRQGNIDSHNHRVRFSWQLAPANAAPIAAGVDFGVITDGRLKTVTGFLDFGPAPQK